MNINLKYKSTPNFKIIERLLTDCGITDCQIELNHSVMSPIEFDLTLGIGAVDNCDITIPHTYLVETNTENYFTLLWKLRAYLAGLHDNSVRTIVYNELPESNHNRVFACDIETTGFNFKSDKILMVGFADLKDPSIVYMFDYDNLWLLFDLFSSNSFVFHNGKFDLKFIERQYGFVPSLYNDTMLMHYCLDERRGTHGLKKLAEMFLGLPDYDEPIKKIIGTDIKIGTDEFTLMAEYAAMDVMITGVLHNYFDSLLVDKRLNNFLLQLSPALMRMETTGFNVDVDSVKHYEDELTGIIEGMKEEYFPNINPNSPKQLSEELFNVRGYHVPEGIGPKPGSTNATVVEYLVNKYPEDELLANLSQYRKAKKICSTYVTGLLNNLYGESAHANYHMIGTVTGRLSCSNPNIQNIPRTTTNEYAEPIRGFFRAPEGYSLICADYSQAELRVIATLSGEENMLKVWREDGDLHDQTCLNLFGEITPEQRTYAKTLNFSLVYGAKAKKIAKELGLSEYEAQDYINKYFKAYPNLAQYLQDQHYKAGRFGELYTSTGRVRRFGPTDIVENGRLDNMAGNFETQSTAGDICMQALIDLDEILVQNNMAKIVATVHDSIYLTVRDDIVKDIAIAVEEIMSDAAKTILPQDLVRFKVDVEIHKRWH